VIFSHGRSTERRDKMLLFGVRLLAVDDDIKTGFVATRGLVMFVIVGLMQVDKNT
jgi:hypothetical protein